jgi:hypothetical protein
MAHHRVRRLRLFGFSDPLDRIKPMSAMVTPVNPRSSILIARASRACSRSSAAVIAGAGADSEPASPKCQFVR